MSAPRKSRRDDPESNPHTEKSTMTEPQEEFIEPKGRPSKPDHPPKPPKEKRENQKDGTSRAKRPG